MSTFRTEMDVSTGVATAVPQRVYSSGASTLVLDAGAAAPAGYVEVIGTYTPPPSRGQIAARRYEAEVGGITVLGVPIDTDDRSKLLINGAALEATIDPAYVMQWKTPTGFIELTSTQVIGIARAVRAHVQACFDREAELLAALDAGTLTPEMLEQGWP